MGWHRNFDYSCADGSDFVHGDLPAFRWGGAAENGMWLAHVSFYGAVGWAHLHCVVDDFGALVPVSVTLDRRIEVPR